MTVRKLITEIMKVADLDDKVSIRFDYDFRNHYKAIESFDHIYSDGNSLILEGEIGELAEDDDDEIGREFYNSFMAMKSECNR